MVARSSTHFDRELCRWMDDAVREAPTLLDRYERHLHYGWARREPEKNKTPTASFYGQVRSYMLHVSLNAGANPMNAKTPRLHGGSDSRFLNELPTCCSNEICNTLLMHKGW